MMTKLFFPLLLGVSLFSAKAQSVKRDRCEISTVEDSNQFENWLEKRRTAFTGQSNKLYRIPVVVHMLHSGEPVGEGFNYPLTRIESQIRVLNEDFRRKEGTPGYNTHADGGDTRIEFVLAEVDPEGNPTDGVIRVDWTKVQPSPGTGGDIITTVSRFSYWDPDQYLNIWCMDLGLPSDIFLGSARFPVSDLPGLEDINNPEGDGVFINALNFGVIENESNYNKGRTLTHEVGHFLGLLHTFGSLDNSKQCDAYTDHCEDTPAVFSPAAGCPTIKPVACDGRVAMIENYMDYAFDACMNIFTNDQISRMHVVLENSPRRNSLLTSPVIDREVTGAEDGVTCAFSVYPNPAPEKVYISVTGENRLSDVRISAYSLSGKLLFITTMRTTEDTLEIPVAEIREDVILLIVETFSMRWTELVVMN